MKPRFFHKQSLPFIHDFYAISRYMKQHLPAPTNIWILVLISVYYVSGIFSFLNAQHLAKDADIEISFPPNLASPSVDFKLKSLGKRKIEVVLDKKTSRNTKVKVYDVIGNLVLEDMIKPEDGTEKCFDFSHVDSQLFVVEVGNSKYNKTKSIYVHPPDHKSVGEEEADL
jgi:hypothetical protein